MAGTVFSKIISVGQTGVDRAALDVALELSIPCSGWCPKGRKAEDGPIDPQYPLKETKSPRFEFRTEAKVMEADGTLILTVGNPTGGTVYTALMAVKHKEPYLIVDLEKRINPKVVLDWAKAHGIRTLNVAGPRESKCSGIYERAKNLLESVLVSK